MEDYGDVRHDALGKIARGGEPEFWQVAGFVPPFDKTKNALAGDRVLFAVQQAVERDTPVHVVSLSTHSVVYKVHGNADILDHYYPQLSSPEYLSIVTLGHSRYSTNTLSNFERVQPFALLGHNGEINTVDKLRREAQMLGIPITRDGSDSQDMDRAMHGLIINHGLSLIEASEIIFPPMAEEVDNLSGDLRCPCTAFTDGCLAHWRRGLPPLCPAMATSACSAWTPSACARCGLGESGTEYFFSSEQGVVPLTVILGDPEAARAR